MSNLNAAGQCRSTTVFNAAGQCRSTTVRRSRAAGDATTVEDAVAVLDRNTALKLSVTVDGGIDDLQPIGEALGKNTSVHTLYLNGNNLAGSPGRGNSTAGVFFWRGVCFFVELLFEKRSRQNAAAESCVCMGGDVCIEGCLPSR
jgi:hypothetical protein